jgi:hypothetical protein
MRWLWTFAVIGTLGIRALGQPATTTADLAFLAGCWKFERSGRVVEEHWLAPAGGSLLGVSRTVAGGKTVEYEFLQIRDLPDGLTYIARPSGQPEARFKATVARTDEIAFENPAHDFPQRIQYRRAGDALNARIDGTRNGKIGSFEYPYVRVSCTP